MSVTRIAHYVKCIMRDNIGSTADGPYIQKQLEAWIGKYITKVSNPDDLTLRYFPFKAATVNVAAKDGVVGFYNCQIAILPHVQFEGMDVELRMESRL
jgi:type VI secretion system protein ImpC